VKRRFQAAIVGAAVAVSAMVLLSAEPGLGQTPPQPDDPAATPEAKAALAKATLEVTARVLTVYDPQGKVVRTVGDRAVYNWPSFSPSRTKLAVSKRDEETMNTDIWVFDLATGASTRVTSDPASDISPVWSPDGSQIVYGSNPDDSPGLYRRASNGTGDAELLYQIPGVPLYVSDWSADGRFLSVNDPVNLYLVPLADAGPQGRKAADLILGGRGGRFSPDGRFLAYVSDQSEKPEIWVRPVDRPSLFGGAPAAGPWQVSDRGGVGMIFWRQDGKALYYMAADQGVMAVDVSTTPAFTFGKPRRLFKAPDPISGSISGTSVSRDGQQFLFNVPPKPRGTRFPSQITVFDRQGKVVRTLAELRSDATPTTPVISPDGSRVAVFLDNDIWSFDIATGSSSQVTHSASTVRTEGDQQSPVWSPDGSRIAFVTFRDNLGRVFQIPSNGMGGEALLYSHLPDIYTMPLTDWSPDGRFLSFDSGGVSWVLPLDGRGQATELMREEYTVYEARFSPDSRYIAFVSDESGRNEVYVRPFESSPSGVKPGSDKWQVSTEGGLGLVQWRRDGRELYYVAIDGGVMAVDVATTPTFHAGTPKLLFRMPATFPLVGIFERAGINAPGCSDATIERCEAGSISRDGQRFVFNVPQPPERTPITVEPGILAQYAGTYAVRGLDWMVTLEGTQLMIQRTAREKAPLFAESETKFFLKATNGDFEFVRDDKGNVKYLFMYRGGTPEQLIRTQ
jgi:Tol biopolymer transport system component